MQQIRSAISQRVHQIPKKIMKDGGYKEMGSERKSRRTQTIK